MKMRAAHLLDFYKIGHPEQYPDGTEIVYSNFTARSGKHSNVKDSKGVLWVGLNLTIKEFLIEEWNETFFNLPKEDVLNRYKIRTSIALNQDVAINRLGALHDLGYLPVRIKSLPEGSFVPYGVPLFTIVNTNNEFFWVTNMLETILSAESWQCVTSATTYREYNKVFKEFAELTGSNMDFVPFQAPDFSLRGMAGRVAGAKSAFGAVAAGSKGTDTLMAIDVAIDYYNTPETQFIAGSVNATEHSVMCAGGMETEIDTFKRLINEVYPTGMLSIVSDTWDFWKVVGVTLPLLKDDILKRDGKVIIRPDSGNPADILCGVNNILNLDGNVSIENMADALRFMEDNIVSTVRGETPHGECGESEPIGYFRFKDKCYKVTVTIDWNRHDKQYYFVEDTSISNPIEFEESIENKGLIQSLWETFGGTVNAKGFKVLDSHIGAIYGDSITLERQLDILQRLKANNFASENVVLGVGSYSYQYTTRDTHGMAMKATSVTIEGERHDIFKNPKTDDGTKKSAKGLLMVSKTGDKFSVTYPATEAQEKRGCLETVFEDGKLIIDPSLDDILMLTQGS